MSTTYSTSFSANALQTSNITYTVPSSLPLVPTTGLYCNQSGVWSWSPNVTSLGTTTGTGADPIVTNTTNGTGALTLKRVIGNTGITVTDNTNDITINNTGILNVIDSATGTGTGTLVKGTTSGTTTLKRMKAGTNITLANGTDDVTINASSTGYDGYVQYNNAGSFGADSKFKYYPATADLILNGKVTTNSLSLWNGGGANSNGNVSFSSIGGASQSSYSVTFPANSNSANATAASINKNGQHILYVSSYDASGIVNLDFTQIGNFFRSDLSNNTKFGTSALSSTTGSTNNTAFGCNALYSYQTSTTGGNAAFGSSSLVSLTTGSQNLGVGAFAGYSLTSGSDNITIGYNCGYMGITVSNGNTCIGSYCKTTGGGGNVTSVGCFSMRYFDGVNNVAFGSNALLGGNTTTGSIGLENVAIGTNSMANVLGTACSSNTCVGFASGLSLNNDVAGTNGTLNCFYGHNAGKSVTTGQNNIVIGAETLGSTTLSNAIVIGYNTNQGVSNNEIVIGNINNTVLRNDNDGTCDIGSATKRFNNAQFAGTVNAVKLRSNQIENAGTSLTTTITGGINGFNLNSAGTNSIGVPTSSSGNNNIYSLKISNAGIPQNAANASHTLVLEQSCANTAGAQLLIRSAVDINKQLLIGFTDFDPPNVDATHTNTGIAPYASLQSIQQLTGTKPLYLQPYLGNVIIGARASRAGWLKPDTPGEPLQINGDLAIYTNNESGTSSALKLYDSSTVAAPTGYVKLKAPNIVTTSYTMTLPANPPSTIGQAITSDLSGNLSYTTIPTLANTVIQGGNTFGVDLVIGTKDNYNFMIKRNNVNYLTISAGTTIFDTADVQLNTRLITTNSFWCYGNIDLNNNGQAKFFNTGNSKSVNLKAVSELASSYTMTLPATTGTAGQLLSIGALDSVTNSYPLNWANGGTPGGSDTQLQMNNAGVFAGISGVTFSGATGSLNLSPSGDTNINPQGVINILAISAGVNRTVNIGTTSTGGKPTINIGTTSGAGSPVVNMGTIAKTAINLNGSAISVASSGTNIINAPSSSTGGNNGIYSLKISGSNIPRNATNASNALVLTQSCANTAGNQLLIQGSTDLNKQLMVGFVDSDPPDVDVNHTNTGTAPYASLQSIQQATGVKPLYFQPFAGNVIVGAKGGLAGWLKPDTPGEAIQLNGDLAIYTNNESGTSSALKLYDSSTVAAPTGYVKLKAPNIVTTSYTMTLPANPPTTNGQAITSDLSGKLSFTNIPTPGGTDTQLQFNDNGVFGASSALTFDKTTSTFQAGSLKINGNTLSSVPGQDLIISADPTGSSQGISLRTGNSNKLNIHPSGLMQIAGQLNTTNGTINAQSTSLTLSGAGNTGIVIDTLGKTSIQNVLNANANIELKNNGQVKFFNTANTQMVNLTAASGLVSSYTMTLPAVAPTAASQVIKTDPTGNLSFGGVVSGSCFYATRLSDLTGQNYVNPIRVGTYAQPPVFIERGTINSGGNFVRLNAGTYEISYNIRVGNEGSGTSIGFFAIMTYAKIVDPPQPLIDLPESISGQIYNGSLNQNINLCRTFYFTFDSATQISTPEVTCSGNLIGNYHITAGMFSIKSVA